jgi:hypothetical protein
MAWATMLVSALAALAPPALSAASFRFLATLHTPQPPVSERRGYHYVLAPPPPPPPSQLLRPAAAPPNARDAMGTSGSLVYGCGINGELTIARLTLHEHDPASAPAVAAAGAALTVLNISVGANLLQSRAMLWDEDGRLVLANRDFLIYDVVAHAGGGRSLRLHANLSTPLSALPGSRGTGAGRTSRTGAPLPPLPSLQRVRGHEGSGNNGINGIITAADGRGTVLLVGAAMPGWLVAATLSTPGSSAPPRPFGAVRSAGFGLGGIYDIDGLRPPPSPTELHPSRPPLAVVVSPHRVTGQKAILGIVRMHDPSHHFLSPANWTLIGSLSFADVTRAAARAALNATLVSRAKGCNRVRVHQRSQRAAFSCFGTHTEGGDIVGFADVSRPEKPAIISVVPFVTQQPTGMLVVGDALFVAGELDIMVFDLSAARPASPPLLTTCGAACRSVGTQRGQNFHSIAYKAVEGRHLIFISAQIDNNMGCVEIVDRRVIALLSPRTRHADKEK